MNYFPNGIEETNLMKFISKYQYINTNDCHYFFTSKKYYKQRISNLIKKNFLKRIKLNLVLDKNGIEYVKLMSFEYNKLNRNKQYLPRLLYLSHFAAFYNNCNNISFSPSFSIKDKETFTTIARKFTGILTINGIKYLTYHISKQHDNKYIYSIIYDIQKERNYKNIIIFIDDKSKIKNISDFTFGTNQVLIIEESNISKEKLKYINSIDWHLIINTIYKNDNISLSSYNFCDYTNYKNKYITTFYFFDTEKINRIQYFLMENKNKKMDVLSPKEIQPYLQKYLPTCNYISIDLENFIKKELHIYD